MRIITTESCAHIFKSVDARIESRIISVRRTHFADSELSVRIIGLRKRERVLVVGNTRLSEDFFDFAFTAAAAKENGAQPIGCITYLGYGRADSADGVGEALRLRCVARMFNTLGTSLIILEPHAPRAMRWFKSACVVSLMPTLAAACKRDVKIRAAVRAKKLVVVAPDVGASERANLFAKEIGAQRIVVFKKTRAGEKVYFEKQKLFLQDSVAIIVDDIISTGATLYGAARLCSSAGATSVFAAVAHGVFATKNSSHIVRKGVEQMWITDSIKQNVQRRGLQIVSLASFLNSKYVD